MLARALCVAALAGCFTPKTPAEKPKVVVYNALAMVGGVAAAFLGWEAFQGTKDADGLGPFIGAMGLAAGVGGGAAMVIGGAFGIGFTYADYGPTH